jgi:hypothetical protein
MSASMRLIAEGIDLNAMAWEAGMENAEKGDGFLLLHTDSTGIVRPYVLQLGLMTEGRIESNLMQIFNSIVSTRTRQFGGRHGH